MIRVLPDPGPLTPSELLNLTPREAALLEALRGLLGAITVTAQMENVSLTLDVGDAFEDRKVTPSAIIRAEGHHHFLTAKGLYLELRRPEIQREASQP